MSLLQGAMSDALAPRVHVEDGRELCNSERVCAACTFPFQLNLKNGSKVTDIGTRGHHLVLGSAHDRS